MAEASIKLDVSLDEVSKDAVHKLCGIIENFGERLEVVEKRIEALEANNAMEFCIE